ncbi:MAG: hypothetical protein GXY20_07405 [Clostridiales bacterium]|nr:hypothetical protein [Clostridiales bacterium]
MKFSLLYRNYVDEIKDRDDPLEEEMSNTVYDLSIDRAARAICRDKESFNYFMEVIKAPLMNTEDIKYRQDILMDFVASPKLLDELRMIFKSYDSLQSDWHEMCSSIYTYGVPSTVKGLLDCTYESLKATSNFARSTVSYFRSISDAVDKYEVKSDGLIGIKEYCSAMSVNESLDEITRIGSYFLREGVAAYEFRVLVETDDTLTIRGSSLLSAVELEARSIGRSLKKLMGNITKTNPPPDDTPEIDMGEFHLEESYTILNDALYEVYTVLSGITGNIYEFFRGLSGELSFFDTGLQYCRYLAQAGMPMCLPKMMPQEEDCFRANGIYDIQLIAEGIAAENIVRNDIRIDKDTDGVLIRGANTSGKTSLLRAFGTAQLFAQAGLPVCATGAVISIRNAVMTLFASSEEEFNAGDAAGRFEGEVQQMARILDRLVPYTLLLLNESFQTTAYREGAVGMQHILEVLPRVKCKYIFVTWLMQMFDMTGGGSVRQMQMGGEGFPAYKIHEPEG